MSLFEEKGCITYKNKIGDLYRLYPVTKRECIDGLEYVDDHVKNTGNPHKVSAFQIGAVSNEDVATLDEVLTHLGIGA